MSAWYINNNCGKPAGDPVSGRALCARTRAPHRLPRSFARCVLRRSTRAGARADLTITAHHAATEAVYVQRAA
eukprot:gene21529-56220_t